MDNGGEIDASPEDLFVVRMREPSTAGYRTKLDRLQVNGFTILKEGYATSFDLGLQSKEGIVVGTFPTYEVVTQHGTPGNAAISIAHGRPWEVPEQSVEALHLALDLRTAPQGLSVEERHKLLETVVADD